MRPPQPSVHDFSALQRGWRHWARQRGYLCQVLEEREGYPILALRPRRVEPAAAWWYFSAGIHGDEPAGVAGLWQWAQNDGGFLERHPAWIFPCLNPWGLVHNMRTDAQGRDLNRAYEDPDGPCGAQMRLLRGWRFQAACCLHEDYDATGIYLYELRGRERGWGEEILRTVEKILPRDDRRRIDGRAFRRALLSRAARRDRLPLAPEAVYLRLHHTPLSFTFETPSEAHILDRTQAQVAFLTSVTQRVATAATTPAPARARHQG